MAGGAGPVPARGRTGLPVGEPQPGGAQAARAGGGAVGGSARPGPRQPQLELRPRPRRARPGAGHRAAPGGLPGAVRRLRQGHHGAGDRRRAVGRGGDQRLPVDHPRPLLRVDRAPPPRRPGPVAGRPPRRDGGGDGAGLHRRQQRGLPVRVRGLAACVRRGVRAAVDRPGLAGGAADHAALPDGLAPHRGGRAAVHDAGPLRRRLPRALQVQPAQAQRDARAGGLRAGPVPDARLRRDRRLRPDPAALLRRPSRHQPDRDRPAGPRPGLVADRRTVGSPSPGVKCFRTPWRRHRASATMGTRPGGAHAVGIKAAVRDWGISPCGSCNSA